MTYTIRKDYFGKAKNSGAREAPCIAYGIIHDGELVDVRPPMSEEAELMGRYFESNAARGSSHFGVDNNTIQQYLPMTGKTAEAWGAPPLNDSGVHIEQAGRAKFTRVKWLASYAAQLDRVAWLMAYVSKKCGIPLRWLTVAQLKAAGPNPAKPQGWVTHDDVSKAFGRSTHWDPGPGWPKDLAMTKAQEYTGGNDEMTDAEFLKQLARILGVDPANVKNATDAAITLYRQAYGAGPQEDKERAKVHAYLEALEKSSPGSVPEHQHQGGTSGPVKR